VFTASQKFVSTTDPLVRAGGQTRAGEQNGLCVAFGHGSPFSCRHFTALQVMRMENGLVFDLTPFDQNSP